jgi:hypothetical protein
VQSTFVSLRSLESSLVLSRVPGDVIRECPVYVSLVSFGFKPSVHSVGLAERVTTLTLPSANGVVYPGPYWIIPWEVSSWPDVRMYRLKPIRSPAFSRTVNCAPDTTKMQCSTSRKATSPLDAIPWASALAGLLKRGENSLQGNYRRLQVRLTLPL